MNRLTLIDKAFLLKRTPLFSMLDLDLLLTIADKLNVVLFDSGDDIFMTNEEANRMYFIVSGKVQIFSSDKQLIAELTNGDFFGEESLFNNKPRAYLAYAPIETQVLTLARTNLYAIISECPSVGIGFLRVYTSILQIRPSKMMESEK